MMGPVTGKKRKSRLLLVVVVGEVRERMGIAIKRLRRGRES